MNSGILVPRHVREEMEQEKRDKNVRSLANLKCNNCYGKGRIILNGKDTICNCVRKNAAKKMRMEKKEKKERRIIITPDEYVKSGGKMP